MEIFNLNLNLIAREEVVIIILILNFQLNQLGQLILFIGGTHFQAKASQE